MSPRAACRLELLGFSAVYDYVLGKIDWMAAGLPTVRADGSERRALDAADRDPPTCQLTTPLRDLPKGQGVIVVSPENVVLGRVIVTEQSDKNLLAEAAMRPGPMTVRAHEPLNSLLERMTKSHVAEMIVSTPEGVLLGLVRNH
jgi:hypothetical protein